MLIIQNGNRQLSIQETEKSLYLGKGYDVIDESGKIVESATNRTVSIETYEALKAEYEAFKQEKEQEKAPESETSKQSGKSK